MFFILKNFKVKRLKRLRKNKMSKQRRDQQRLVCCSHSFLAININHHQIVSRRLAKKKTMEFQIWKKNSFIISFFCSKKFFLQPRMQKRVGLPTMVCVCVYHEPDLCAYYIMSSSRNSFNLLASRYGGSWKLVSLFFLRCFYSVLIRNTTTMLLFFSLTLFFFSAHFFGVL